MLVCKLDVNDVGAWFCWTVGNFAGPILQVFCVDVNLARAFNGQTQPTIAYKGCSIELKGSAVCVTGSITMVDLLYTLNGKTTCTESAYIMQVSWLDISWSKIGNQRLVPRTTANSFSTFRHDNVAHTFSSLQSKGDFVVLRQGAFGFCLNYSSDPECRILYLINNTEMFVLPSPETLVKQDVNRWLPSRLA